MITTQNHLNHASASPGVACACCGRPLGSGDGFCAQCQTPADLSRTVASRESGHQFVSILGASGAGKTVYLGLLLDLLSKGAGRLRGLATSPFSISLQEQVVTALQHRVFPEKTPAEADEWSWLHCQITAPGKKGEKQVDLLAPDFAGEAIAMEVNQSGMYPIIQNVVAKSRGLLILCDSLKVRDEGSAEDLFAMKLASYIAGAHPHAAVPGKKSKPCGPAIAVVFTKCDSCAEAQEDPQAFAANNVPRLWEFCRQTFARHAFFSASVAGGSGVLADSTGQHLRIPLHIEPHGISEPLEWIIEHY